MKKKLCILLIVFLALVFIILKPANAVRRQFSYSLVGEITSVDFSSETNRIYVQYTHEDKYYNSVTEQMELRLEENTRILDEAGKELESQDLKVGDTVSVSYKNKYIDYIPSWKIAQIITLIQTAEDPDKK